MEEGVTEPEDTAVTVAEPAQPTVLELQGVSFCSRAESGIHFQNIDLALREGELGMVQVNAATRTREAASLIQGLTPPLDGRIMFCDEDWLGSDYDRHFQMRNRIGRVFEGQAWIENLNVDENVTLACRHHGTSDAAIREELRYWSTRLGIDHVSRQRPAFVEPSILQVHQWLRALLGSPKLLILERPLQFLPASWLPKLVEVIDILRSRGAAVLWFTNELDLGDASPDAPILKWRLQDEKLHRCDGGSGDE